jgi:hypothetical protein
MIQPRTRCLPARYHSFPSLFPRKSDLYSGFLARFVLDNRLDAIQTAKAWRGADAFLRVASNGFEPASRKGFAFPHVALGVRAGRSKKYHANHREAGDDVLRFRRRYRLTKTPGAACLLLLAMLDTSKNSDKIIASIIYCPSVAYLTLLDRKNFIKRLSH